MEEFNINYLKNEYGLSCIEDYILYLLAQRTNNWQQIFFESYLPFCDVMECISKDQGYSYFTGVQRLQRTGEMLGLLKLSYYTNDNFPREFVEDKIFAMQVSENFVNDKFNTTLWRRDHYMLFQYKGNNTFEYINDIPKNVGCITTKEMSEIYERKIIVIEVNNVVQSNYQQLIQQLATKVILSRSERRYAEEDISFERLRDAIGINKVLVKRIESFIGLLDIPFSASNYYEMLCNYYIKAEYMRVRNADRIAVPIIISEIEEEDRRYKNELIIALQKGLHI